MATGWKMKDDGRPSYFSVFRLAASTASDSPSPDWCVMYEPAQGCTIVASHAMYFPRSQGTSVAPSGLLPSALKSPVGSLVLGISALVSARQSMSLLTGYYYYYYYYYYY